MSRAAAAEPPIPIFTPGSSIKSVSIRRELLTPDPDIRARESLDEKTVERYAALMRDGTEFPPLVVFDDGVKLRLSDGYLRDAAAERAGFEVVLCEMRRGTRRDAQLYAIQANGRHGQPLTPADRRRAVERLLADPEWSRWSDRTVGKLAGVSHSVVNRMRRRRPELKGRPRVVVRGGQVYEWTRAKESREPNYYTDYLYYFVRLSPQQFIRFKQLVGLKTDRKVFGDAIATIMREQAEGKESATNYAANWPVYLLTMTPAQLLQWRDLVKNRVAVAVLAEAVDVVLKMSPRVEKQAVEGRE